MALFIGITFGVIVCFVMMFVIASKISALATQRDKKEITGGAGERGGVELSFDEELRELGIPPHKQVRASQVMRKLAEDEADKKTLQYAKVVQDKDRAFKRINQKLEAVSKSYEKLGREKKQTEAVVRSLADGVIVVNDKGETLLMNPAAEKLLGMKREQAIGKNVLDSDKEDQVVSFAAPAGAGQEEREITLMSGSDTTKKTLRSSSAVIENEFGQTMGMVSVLTDVTKQKELEDMKGHFVASVSHELRTPLNCIQESVSLMLDKVLGEVSPEQERVLTLASRNIKRLTSLINDLLDLSKMEAGEMRLSPSEFLVDDLVQHTQGTFEAWAKTKKIRLESILPPEKVKVYADQDKLTQVLTNLVGNAMKFVPEDGNIRIEVQKAHHEANGAVKEFIEFAVQDNGPGIPKTEQDKIFKKFSQTKAGAKAGGTGLGLTISRQIVQLHGGRIWVESEEERGSRFAFLIPVRCENGQPNMTQEEVKKHAAESEQAH